MKFCRKTKTNHTRAKEDSIKHIKNKQTFIFSVNNTDVSYCDLLVDCGATTHILNDDLKFISFHKNFDPSRHVVELVDRSKYNNLALKRGDACVKITDTNGKVYRNILKNVLYIPSFDKNILSIQAVTENGAKVEFKPNSATLNTQGTTFEIHKKGKLYYLNNICSPKKVMLSLEDWHKIMGHCNVDDILKFEVNIEGMQLTDRNKFKCEICPQAKMSQLQNRLLNICATKILEIIHVDLAGPIDLIAKDSFKYVLGCIDDYSGLIVTYMLYINSNLYVKK